MSRNTTPPPRRSSSFPPPSEPPRSSLRSPLVPREARPSSIPPGPQRPSSIPPVRDEHPNALMRYTLTPAEVKVLQHLHSHLQSFGDKGAIMGNFLAVLMALDRGVGEVEHFTELSATRVLLDAMRASAPGAGQQGGQA